VRAHATRLPARALFVSRARARDRAAVRGQLTHARAHARRPLWSPQRQQARVHRDGPAAL
jgi:hypothetical protein